jgi:hypothetical protein
MATEEVEKLSQDEYEDMLHAVVWPGLDEEPEADEELNEEVDTLIWEIVKDTD